VDGDTIEVIFSGEALDIRLIGIDTPETVHPSQPIECFGKAASRFTERQLEDQYVGLEFDVERLDRYGRTLAYLWLRGKLFNEVLVRDGYAQVSTFPPNVKYVDRFLAAQRAAREAGRGLWSACGGGMPAPPDEGGEGATCDRQSYPDVCIAPYPPDLDCDEVPHSDFRVMAPDPHGFDGDGDGVGCER
jgi:micrococcal nuclease